MYCLRVKQLDKEHAIGTPEDVLALLQTCVVGEGLRNAFPILAKSAANHGATLKKVLRQHNARVPVIDVQVVSLIEQWLHESCCHCTRLSKFCNELWVEAGVIFADVNNEVEHVAGRFTQGKNLDAKSSSLRWNELTELKTATPRNQLLVH